MTGIVLAGGENRRMGTDKAFLAIDGTPMITHVLRALRNNVERVIIVTNSPEAYSPYDADIVTDAFPVRGPLTGIYTGLVNSADEYNVVVACDMPFLNHQLIAYLMTVSAGYDVTLPQIGDFFEPLHAVYRKTVLPVIERHLREGRKRIQDIFDGLRVRPVTEQEIDRLDPGRRSFRNLNTPEEYKEAICSD